MNVQEKLTEESRGWGDAEAGWCNEQPAGTFKANYCLSTVFVIHTMNIFIRNHKVFWRLRGKIYLSEQCLMQSINGILVMLF